MVVGLRPVAATPSVGAVAYLPFVQSPAPLDLPRLPGDWLGQVNFYRFTANLPPVAENPAWSVGNALHARYGVKTDTLQHDEDPGSPWYTSEGQAAAQKSNIAATFGLQANDAWAIATWMQAPFHALGILDPRLTHVGHGLYREADGGLQTASGLDVLRGLNYALIPRYPVLWPAHGAVIPLTYHWGSYPDPLASCPGYTSPSGLPLLVQLGPGNLTPTVTASSFSRAGLPLQHCVFTEATYSHPDGAAQSLGRAILGPRDAVVLVPRAPLSPGAAYTVSIAANGVTHTWTFAVAAAASTASTLNGSLAVPTFADLAPSLDASSVPPRP
jgi:hypothetical protein